MSVFILFPILLLWYSSFPYILILLFNFLCPFYLPGNCLVLSGHQKKSWEHTEGCSHCFQCHMVPGMGGIAQSLAQPLHSLECWWMLRGKGDMYRAFWTVPRVQSHERQKFGSMVWKDLNCFILAWHITKPKQTPRSKWLSKHGFSSYF